MKKLLAIFVLAVLVTGCILVEKEAHKECDKAGENCESVSENEVNSD